MDFYICLIIVILIIENGTLHSNHMRLYLDNRNLLKWHKKAVTQERMKEQMYVYVYVCDFLKQAYAYKI